MAVTAVNRGTQRLCTAFAAPHSWISCKYSNTVTTLSFQNHLPYKKAVRQKAASMAASQLSLCPHCLQVKLLYTDAVGQGHQCFVTQWLFLSSMLAHCQLCQLFFPVHPIIISLEQR